MIRLFHNPLLLFNHIILAGCFILFLDNYKKSEFSSKVKVWTLVNENTSIFMQPAMISYSPIGIKRRLIHFNASITLQSHNLSL
jgi:hypothetical protein